LIITGQFAIAGVAFNKEPAIEKYFSKKGIPVNVHSDTIQGWEVRYIETYLTENNDNLVFLLHGAKSEAMKFRKILSDTMILNHARIVALDRPGYGGSSSGEAMISIEQQTEIVARVLDQFSFKTCILVGHSYGAAIVANYASKHPEKDLKLIMLAPAIDPELEVIFVPKRIKENGSILENLPKKFQVATLENYAHKKELEKILDIWGRLAIPVYHLHGGRDMIISDKNIDFSKENIDPQYLTTELLENDGHALLLFRPGKIASLIMKMLE